MTTIGEASSWSRNPEVSIEMEGSNLRWIQSIINAGDETGGVQANKRIHRVLQLLKHDEDSEKHFRPMMVAIGPYHHHDEKLQEVQELKPLTAKHFLKELDIHRVFTEFSYEMKIQKILGYYDSTYVEGMDIDQFVQMIFLDGCFVLHYIDCSVKEAFGHQKLASYKDFVPQDLLLMENQLPFLVLDFLIKRFSCQEQREKLSNIDFFIPLCMSDPLRLPQRQTINTCELLGNQSQMPPHHLLHLLRERRFCSETNKASADHPPGDNSVVHSYTYRGVKELMELGIHFQCRTRNYLGDITFQSHLFHGRLLLHPIIIDDSTKRIFLNLIAYEMSPDGPRNHIVTSYIYFLDMLIDKAEDAKELRLGGILKNYLSSDKDVAELFNSITKNVVPNLHTYGHVMNQIQNHCDDKGKIWMAQVINQHFSSPWTVVGFIAAVFTILLTIGQTFFTIFPREKPTSGSLETKQPRMSRKQSN